MDKNKKKADFSDLCGVWSDEEARIIEEAIEEMFEKVDPEDWK